MNTSRKLLPKRTSFSDRNRFASTSNYCLDLVKKYDYENFISTILLKNKARSCALAVRSFNVEVSRVAEQVSQPSIGLMRMKFWEETLDKCFSKDVQKVPQHPVAIELFKVINACKLNKRYFQNLIVSRKELFGVQHMNTLEDLEKYSEQSVSNVYYLILEGCSVKNVHADHAASHLGKAQGIVQYLRCVPLARRLNMIPIPQDILLKNNVSQEDILRSRSSKELSDCIYEVATRAHQHVMKSRKLAESVPLEGRPALLPAIVVLDFLERLQKTNYDIFHPSLKHRSLKLLPTLWLANFRNKY